MGSHSSQAGEIGAISGARKRQLHKRNLINNKSVGKNRILGLTIGDQNYVILHLHKISVCRSLEQNVASLRHPNENFIDKRGESPQSFGLIDTRDIGPEPSGCIFCGGGPHPL